MDHESRCSCALAVRALTTAQSAYWGTKLVRIVVYIYILETPHQATSVHWHEAPSSCALLWKVGVAWPNLFLVVVICSYVRIFPTADF